MKDELADHRPPRKPAVPLTPPAEPETPPAAPLPAKTVSLLDLMEEVEQESAVPPAQPAPPGPPDPISNRQPEENDDITPTAASQRLAPQPAARPQPAASQRLAPHSPQHEDVTPAPPPTARDEEATRVEPRAAFVGQTRLDMTAAPG
ncbi:MAG: hypothetical protein AB1791_17560, partial [Chloroflexota bacterium]